jgi:hypothetical protein
MWYKTIFPVDEMDGMIKEDITIIHNMNEQGLCGTAFSTWYIRLNGKEPTAESFAAYITSKKPLSGYEAFTEEDFKKKYPKITPKYQR